jgi:site-specific DNA recombinase
VSKRAAVYVRVSTQEQSEKGWSIDGQIEECERFCESKGYTILEVFRDEGLSGSDLERPGLLAVLDFAESQGIDSLVLWRFDRLSRNDVDFLSLLRLLDEMGVEVDSVTEPLPSQGPYGQFMMGMLGLMANLERNILRMRTMKGGTVQGMHTTIRIQLRSRDRSVGSQSKGGGWRSTRVRQLHRG